MNQRQRKVLIAGAILVALSILYPPWVQIVKTDKYSSQQAIGYHFIQSPPKMHGYAFGHTIDTTRLIIQLFGIFLMTGFGIYFLKTPPPKPPTAKPQNASERQQYPTRTVHSQKR